MLFRVDEIEHIEVDTKTETEPFIYRLILKTNDDEQITVELLFEHLLQIQKSAEAALKKLPGGSQSH